MAEAVKGMYIPYHWVDEIAINDEGVIDEEYSREVAWELLKALKAQAKGQEIQWPKDRYLKAIIRGYLQQEKTMQKSMQTFTNNKKGGLSDKEFNDLIYKLALEGKDGPAIYKILTEQYGCTHKSEDFIYKKAAWKQAKADRIQLKEAENNIQENSAENEENSGKYVF